MRIIIGWLILFTVSGCSEYSVADLTSFIESVNARESQSPIDLLPAQKAVDPYAFNSDGLRDPFNPFNRASKVTNIQLPKGNGLQPDFTRQKEELEAYPLDTLRMVGTLKMDSVSWALVKVQDGTIHRVHKGNYMGINHGNIIQITEAGIELMEIIPGSREGLWQETQQSLVLTVKTIQSEDYSK